MAGSESLHAVLQLHTIPAHYSSTRYRDSRAVFVTAICMCF